MLGISVAKAFRMYEEHKPGLCPLYQLYQLPRIVKDPENMCWFLDRFIIRIPHPSNVNYRGIDKNAVRRLLAKRFARANKDRIAELLETLASLGKARELVDGRYVAV